MFCPTCRCEFVGWTGGCPNCKTPLVNGLPPIPRTADRSISYEAFVDLVRENGGQLSIDLSTAEVARKRKWGFPYSGYGFGWTKRLQGAHSEIVVDLFTVEVGRGRRWGFPYSGYGYAWAKGMHGSIGGNEISLAATKVVREKRWRFPYFGYGYAWTQEMSGNCGDQLKVDLLTTEVGRHKEWRFPWLGYGFAWAKRSVLTFTLLEGG